MIGVPGRFASRIGKLLDEERDELLQIAERDNPADEDLAEIRAVSGVATLEDGSLVLVFPMGDAPLSGIAAEDIGKVLQVPGNYAGRSNVSEELYANQTLDGINGVMSPEELRRKMTVVK